MDDLSSRDFSAVAWLNSHLNIDHSSSIEEQVTQQLARLQFQSRALSQSTDQHIRTLVSELPQAIAKLSHISSSVSEISDSVRGLTNSGYKFKSGNVPDKITELSTLMVRRDRLREASTTLKLGIEFETQLGDLKVLAPSESLEIVCGRYEKVGNASRALASIQRFAELQGELEGIHRVIENRLGPELESACARKNSEGFAKFAGLAQRISVEDLPNAVLLTQYRTAVTEVISRLTEGPLGITEWINPCFEQFREVTLSIWRWASALAVVRPSIGEDFLGIASQLLSTVIEPRAQRLLKSTDFPSLSQVVQTIQSFAATFPGELGVSPGAFLGGCIDAVQANFPGVLQSYLAPHLQPPPKPAPKSPLRAPARPSVEPFDNAKFGRLVQIGINCLPWIRILSQDHSRCVAHVCTFLTSAVKLTITERAASRQKPDDASFEIALVDLVRYYTSQVENGRRMEQFEADAAALCGSALQSLPSAALGQLLAAVEGEILDVMVARSLATLSGVATAGDWTVTINDDEAAVFEGTSRYVTTISSLLLGLMRQLGETDGLSHSLVGRWMIRAAGAVLSGCLAEFRKIPALSTHGRRQLLADVRELKNLFDNWIPESGAALAGLIDQLVLEIREPTVEGVVELRKRIDSAIDAVGKVNP
jgi:hypothetical protein